MANTANARETALNKRIIVSCDGTWLSSDRGDHSKPSNAARLARAIAPNGLDDAGRLIKQVVLYVSGLGSGDLPFQQAIMGGFGWGLDQDVTQCYEFITNNYEPGDELFLFGFSRGAFTARSVAGLISNVGVLSSCHMPKFPELWRAYRKNLSGRPFRESFWYLEHATKLGLKSAHIKVVGVWETVGALGIPEYPFVERLQSLGLPINKQFAFHDTTISKNVDYAFQALAIDEQRFTFPPTLWHTAPDVPAKDLQQCWFPGVHSDIGGQAPTWLELTGDHGEIGFNTFAWMVDNVSNMLTFEESSIKAVIEDHYAAMEANQIRDAWGSGKIVDNFSGIVGFFFSFLGQQTRSPGAYPQDTVDWTKSETKETFHPTVRIRKRKVSWNPPALEGFRLSAPDGRGSPWAWAKRGMEPIPEYVMQPEKTMSIAYWGKEGEMKYKSAKSLSRVLCPDSILRELDEANGIVVARESL